MGNATVPSGLTGEGSAAANPPSGQSISRNASHSDTDDNAVDFTASANPTPMGGKPTKPILNPAKIGDEKLTISWSKARNARSYSVGFKTTDATEYSDAGETQDTTETISDLVNGTTYSIRVIAVNKNGVSEPALQTAEPNQIIEATVAYVRDNKPASHFGPGVVTALVDYEGNDIDADDKPFITFHRPNSDPVRGPLVYDQERLKWIASLFVTKGTSQAQDGTVDVELGAETPGKKFTITTSPSFTIDTVVSKPIVAMQSRCPAAADSFTATGDNDVERIYIYQVPPTSQTTPIAVAPVVNGKTDEVFIGNNKVEKLYLVAQDKTGNVSDPLEAINDIRSPEPNLQLEAKDSVITASWPKIDDATEYVLRWRAANEQNWQEETINGTSKIISVPNDKEYEIAVKSKDAACNESAFVSRKATARSQTVATMGGRGGAAEREARILSAAYGEKDGALNEKEDGKGPSALPEGEDKNRNGILDRGEGPNGNGIKDGEEDKDGNGIKDGQEDKDGNGIKDGEEDKNNNGIPDGEEDQNGLGVHASPKPTESPEAEAPSFFQDRSRLIIALAILLIVAGTALAAYSWYRGDETPPSDRGPEGKGDGGEPGQEEIEEETAEERRAERPERRRGGRGRRKTRW
jgi:hypothetical protein